MLYYINSYYIILNHIILYYIIYHIYIIIYIQTFWWTEIGRTLTYMNSNLPLVATAKCPERGRQGDGRVPHVLRSLGRWEHDEYMMINQRNGLESGSLFDKAPGRKVMFD